jgi:hypothetical protein
VSFEPLDGKSFSRLADLGQPIVSLVFEIGNRRSGIEGVVGSFGSLGTIGVMLGKEVGMFGI